MIQGGTELGANVKNEDSRCFAKVEGDNLVLVYVFVSCWCFLLLFRGRLKLDYTPLHVHATINLDTFEGQGKVEVVDDWKVNK